MKTSMIWIVTSLLMQPKCLQCSNESHVDNLYTSLFHNYNRKLFPLTDHNDMVKIHCSIGIVSINSFDELSGEIELTLLINFHWIDEKLNWIPSDFGGKSTLLVPPEDVWLPQLHVFQSYDIIQEITNNSIMVRLFSSGQIKWNLGSVLKIVCSVDVTYFPFDTQHCVISISGTAYTSEELLLYTTESAVMTDYLSQSSQWIISSATVQNRSSESGPDFPPGLNIKLSLKRRSDFFIVYIIVPMIILSCINNLVFVMPANSGERTSVAITTFLSFIVFMQMINSTVPRSSDPMAYIYFYVLFLLIYSSVILFLCILSLRIYDKDTPVPIVVVKAVYMLRCWWMRKKKATTVTPDRKMSSVSEEVDTKNIHENTENRQENGFSTVTWKLVGKTFDLYCLLILYFVYVVITSVIFSNLYNNRGL